jgi:hypothetical protein
MTTTQTPPVLPPLDDAALEIIRRSTLDFGWVVYTREGLLEDIWGHRVWLLHTLDDERAECGRLRHALAESRAEVERLRAALAEGAAARQELRA